jgi:hypothetical protein
MSIDFSNINPCGGCCDDCGYKKTESVKAAVRWRVNVLSYGRTDVRFTDAVYNIKLIFVAFAMNFLVSGL